MTLKWSAAIVLSFAIPLHAQSSNPDPMANMPSKSEIDELAAKAAEKVESFQTSIDLIKPYLDKADSSAYAKDENAVSGARTILSAIKKNGPSAYGLVSLLATLDDLNLDAEKNSESILILITQAMNEKRPVPDGMTTAILILKSTASSFYDISELVMHATLRFIAGEEAALAAVTAGTK